MNDDWYPTTGLLAQVGPDRGEVSKPPVPGYTEDDVDLMGRLMYAEAGNQGDAGMAGVGWSVINRIKAGKRKGYGDSIGAVIHQKGAYTSVGQDRWNGYGNPQAPQDRTAREQARNVARRILQGEIKDNTEGSQFFHSMKEDPTWLKKAIDDGRVVGPVVKIGNHTFHRDNR